MKFATNKLHSISINFIILDFIYEVCEKVPHFYNKKYVIQILTTDIASIKLKSASITQQPHKTKNGWHV